MDVGGQVGGWVGDGADKVVTCSESHHERKALNLVVVGSSSAVGVVFRHQLSMLLLPPCCQKAFPPCPSCLITSFCCVSQ